VWESGGSGSRDPPLSCSNLDDFLSFSVADRPARPARVLPADRLAQGMVKGLKRSSWLPALKRVSADGRLVKYKLEGVAVDALSVDEGEEEGTISAQSGGRAIHPHGFSPKFPVFILASCSV
jgi:hypothetical protein